MATNRYANPGDRLFDSAGNLLSNGKLFFYTPGTTTEKAIYTTSALSVERDNPVILSGTGLIPPIFLDGEYDVVVQNKNGVQVDTGDDLNIGGINGVNLQDWSSTQNYPLDALAIGSDDNIYISLVANNLNNNPVSTVGTSWDYFLNSGIKRGLTAGTTQTQGGATAMTASINEFSTVANANDGGALPSGYGIGQQVLVVNNGANDMQVWPASGDSIDDGATDAVDPDAIEAGSSRLYTRQTATKWSADKAVVANTITAVASGALANGDTVIINADETVSAVSGSAETTGSPVVFESATTTNIASVFDSNAGKVVIAYTDGGNSSYGTAVVGTVSGTSISFGTPVVFESGGATDNISITFDSTNNKVVIAYRDFANSQHGTAVVGTVSGTSISFGTPVVFASATTTGTAATFDSNAGKVVIAYQNATDQGVAIVGTVSGTSISFGTAVTFATATTTEIKATFDSNANKVVLVFVDNGNSSYGTAIIGTVSGTSISFGTEVVFESASTSYASPVFETSTNKVVIAYEDVGNSGAGTAIVGTVSGTTISFGSPVIFETGNVGYVSTVYDSNLDKIVIAYHDVDNSTYGTVVTGAVSGTSLSFETPIVFESATTNYVSASFDSAANRVAIAYTDQGNSSYGTGIVYKSLETNLESENFVGFSDGVYADAETATIQLIGAVDDAQSGLTPGQKYYVQVDGSISLTEDTPSVYAGLAKSSTEIIVKG